MKVLVAAGSKHGATEEIAHAIGDELILKGLEVEVTMTPTATDLSGADAVVIGSAVYAGSWMKSIKRFVTENQAALATKRVWLFSSGPVGEPPKPEEDPTDAAPMMAATGAEEHLVFAGKIDRSKLGLAERAIVKALKIKEGDYRPWDDIRAWTDTIARSLSESNSTSEPPRA